MRTLRLIPLLVSQVLAFQTYSPPKTALERPGLHHATVRGRFVTQGGEPVAGVTVQLVAGSMYSLALASAQADADGRFVFRDVSTRYPPAVRYFPPEQWLRGQVPLAGESDGECDAGDIKLRDDTVIRVSVQVVGGAPLQARDEPTAILTDATEIGPRIVGRKVGEYQVLRQITLEEGRWEIHVSSPGKFEYYEAPVRIQRGRRDQLFTIRLLRDTVEFKNYRSVGKMEVQESTLPPYVAPEKTFLAEGRLLAPDGSPMEGAFLIAGGGVFQEAATSWTPTDSAGRFQLSYRSEACTDPRPIYGERGLQLDRPPRGEETSAACEQRWSQPRDLTARRATRLPIVTPGFDAAKVQAYWWHASLGWQKYSSLQPWMTLTGYEDVALKAEAAGYLPLMQSVKLPRIQYDSKEPLPALPPAEFRFDQSVKRELLVRGGGRAVLVDVELITDLVKNQRRLLKTYQTDTNGRLRLAGGGESLIEVFVYAPGFEPTRAIWNPGRALTVNLAPRNATLSFTRQPSFSLARIRNMNSPQAIRSVWLDRSLPALIKLTAGTYDITVYDTRGAVAGYQRQTIGAGQKKSIDPKLDQRPRLTIRYPDRQWSADISESTPAGGATGWTTWGFRGGTGTLRDVPAVRQSQTSTEAVFLLSRAGRMHIELRRDRETLRLWRDIDTQPGESVTVVLPETAGTIRGAMRSYEQGSGSAHGFAGPRLQLIADDPAGWSLTEYTPRRSGDEFTINGVPAGKYHVHQHLIGEQKSYKTSEGFMHKYASPIDAWGGITVTVVAGETAQLKDFIDYPFRDLEVAVCDAHGQPLENATLRIRDRMSESWNIVAENPGYVREAAHPIPYPAAARILHGVATLPRIRAGQLELFVEMDSGGSYGFQSLVAQDGRLILRLPALPR